MRCTVPSLAGILYGGSGRAFSMKREIAAEEIGAVTFKPLRGFAQLLEPSERTRPSSPRRRSHVWWHEIDLGQLPAIVFKRDAGHCPVPFTGDHYETISRTEPDLEWVTRPVSGGHDLLEAEPS